MYINVDPFRKRRFSSFYNVFCAFGGTAAEKPDARPFFERAGKYIGFPMKSHALQENAEAEPVAHPYGGTVRPQQKSNDEIFNRNNLYHGLMSTSISCLPSMRADACKIHTFAVCVRVLLHGHQGPGGTMDIRTCAQTAKKVIFGAA